MNGTAPRSNPNLLLEIKPSSYLSGNTRIDRDTIYIGEGSTAGTFKIDTSGLIVDCGTW
jgi:hypothetical protein